MPPHDLPEVSEPSTAPVDPCAAARCEHRAVTAVVLRLGGREVPVRLCQGHADRRRADAVPARRDVVHA
ncbi:MAG: hypothetical protein JWN17_1741 [Frankiales bacterium]|nr:hypothetical protein [Frankiales bacterium]